MTTTGAEAVPFSRNICFPTDLLGNYPKFAHPDLFFPSAADFLKKVQSAQIAGNANAKTPPTFKDTGAGVGAARQATDTARRHTRGKTSNRHSALPHPRTAGHAGAGVTVCPFAGGEVFFWRAVGDNGALRVFGSKPSTRVSSESTKANCG